MHSIGISSTILYTLSWGILSVLTYIQASIGNLLLSREEVMQFFFFFLVYDDYNRQEIIVYAIFVDKEPFFFVECFPAG